MSLRDFVSEISDVLFPPLCLACRRVVQSVPPAVFCANCLDRITFLTGSLCPVCGVLFPDSPAGDHVCGACLASPPFFDRARAAVVYEGIISDTIHRFKYGRDLSTGGALARFLAECPFDDLDWHRCDAVLPVPLHKKRLRERGFNQSLLLARALGRKYGIAVDFSLLKRRKFTLTQTGLTRQEREKNIKGAFETARPGQIADKNLILVDDVYTTGATVNECARILKHSGAADVAVVTLARVI
ncbi:MAG: ComF family protein [Deltaproteobacteria bacterium]|nr:ComF family protein [Syntrophaceae bacterium]